jgi:uncharacterized protein (DUF1330 family)
MAASVIADFEVLDVEGMRPYLERVGSSIERYGGSHLVRGERGETSRAAGTVTEW